MRTSNLGLAILCLLGACSAAAGTDVAATAAFNNSKNDVVSFNSPKIEQQFGSIEEFSKNQVEEQKNSELIKNSGIPQNCVLRSYLQDGTMVHYVCNGTSVYTGVVVPDPDIGLDEKGILAQTVKTPGCGKEPLQSEIGSFVLCQTPEHDVFANYVRTNSSSLVLTAVAPEAIPVGDIASMQNFGLEMYYYVRHMATSEERIKFITQKRQEAKECVRSECLWE